MRILKARPMATAALAAMAAAVAAFFLLKDEKIILLVLSFLLPSLTIFTLSVGKRCHSTKFDTLRITLSLMTVTIFVTLLTSVYHFHFQAEIPQTVINSGTYHTVECTVTEEGSAGTGYAYYTVSLQKIDGQSASGKAELQCEYTATAHLGDIIRAKVLIQSLETFHTSDEVNYAIADGIRVCLISDTTDDFQIIDHDTMPLRRLFANWRANLSARLYSLTGKRCGGLATALFLGDRSGLDARISANFRRTGVSHLLALSGMHVTLLMGMAASLTSAFGIPKRGRLLLLTALSITYLALVGFRLSAIRATGMLLLFYCSEFIGTRRDPLTSLCVIGWGILTVSPSAVVDGGFWMSFAAVFGLVTVFSEYNKWLNSKIISSKLRYVCQTIVASTVAVTAVAYLSWLFCGEITPIGILVTALLSPILTWILTLIPLVLLLDILPFFSADLTAPLLSTALQMMIFLTDRISRLRNITFSLQIPFSGILLGIMTIALLFMMIVPLRRKILLVIPPLLTILALIISTQIWNHIRFDEHLQAAYIVRSSGSALTVTDDEGTAVIDTSAGSYSMLRDVEEAITEQGVTEIEHLILTHYHRANIYSTERLAKRQIIRCLWAPIPQTEADYLHLCALRDRLIPLGTEVRCYEVGETLELFENTVFQLVDASVLKRSSQPILTYMVQTPQEVLTYTSPVVQESDYYPTFRWIYSQTDILILGNHGPTLKKQLKLPFENSSPRLTLTDSTETLAYLHLPYANAHDNPPIITNIQCYRFQIIK